MFFLATAPDESLEPPRPPPSLKPANGNGTSARAPLLVSTPAPAKYLSRASRWGTAYVRSGQVGDWDRYGEYAGTFAGECERVYQQWKERAKEKDVTEVGNGHVPGQGVREPTAVMP